MAATLARIQTGELQLPEPNAVTPLGKAHRNALAKGDTGAGGLFNIAMMLRFVPRGRASAIEMMQRAARNGDISALRWWTVWQDLREIDRKKADLDAICEAAGVAPDEFMAVVISTAMRLGNDSADLVAAIMHPRIVAQTARSAMRIGGEHAEIAQKDRQWMLENRKFIAGPKGTVVNVNAQANAAAAAAAQPSVPTFLGSLGSALTSQRSVQRAITDAIDAEAVDAGV